MSARQARYNEWLRRQELLAYEAREIAMQHDLRANVIRMGRKPPILRIKLNGDAIEFRIKEVKDSKRRSIWLAKVQHVTPDFDWLLHSESDGEWSYIQGKTVMEKGVRRQSDFDKGSDVYVVNRTLFKTYTGLLRRLRKKEETMKQKVLTKWFKSSQE